MFGHKALLVTVTVTASFAAEKTIQQSDLPKAVRDALPAQTSGADIKKVIRESTQGKTTYEVETVKNGLTRDMVFSASGAVLETEEEVKLEAIPANSRTALLAKAGQGKIEKVESLTKNGKVSYEAVVDRNGKKSEISAR